MKYKSIIQNSILVLSSCFLTLGVQTSSTHEADSPTYTNKTTVTRITAKDLNNNQPLLMSTLIYYAITHISDGRWIEVSDIDRGWQIQKTAIDGGIHYLVWPDKRIKNESKHIEPNWFEINGDTVVYHSFIIHSQGYEVTNTISLKEIVNTVNTKHGIIKINSMLENLVIV